MAKVFYTYILASGRNGTLYVGVTSNLAKRVHEHKTHSAKGFTDAYDVTKLVFYEQADSAEAAIAREKQLKRWHREWKLNLIEAGNPDWRDLADDF